MQTPSYRVYGQNGFTDIEIPRIDPRSLDANGQLTSLQYTVRKP